ncbi:MAG: hypothetical protein AAFX06_03770 [Planctomycetota bacterium]
MKVISLNCNHCGAPLDVPEKARFATCGFCEARLAIERTGNSYSTSVLDEIKETTQQIARDVAELKNSEELRRLDDQWNSKREQFMVTRKNGSRRLATKNDALLGSVLAFGFGIVWLIFAASIGAPGFFLLFGMIVIAGALFGGFTTYSKAEAYTRAQSDYQRRRRDILSQRNG